MEIRLLGPMEVWGRSGPIDPGSPRQRCVLAALVVDTGRIVSVETLVDRVWGSDPPKRVRHALYTYISRIRSILREAADDGGSETVVRRSHGYLLSIDPDRVDLHRFLRLGACVDSREVPDTERASVLREAVALWRGTLLPDITGDWAARMRDLYTQRYVETSLRWAEAELRCDNAGVVLGPLTQLTHAFPLMEDVAALFMRTLAATGRTAGALAHFTAVRRRLVDQLGIEPGPALRQAQQDILREERDIVTVRSGGPDDVPRQLPLPVPAFSGRDEEVSRLDAMLHLPTGSRVCLVTGPAGVGKTTLAVHWAHRVAGSFPDGHLFLDLRGFDPDHPAVTPTDAIRTLLDALHVPPGRVPADPAAQVGLYRTTVARKRLLLILDNVTDVDQVRPLLPGSGEPVVVVTSRNQLIGLVAAAGAYVVGLDFLPPAQAHDMFVRRVGAERAAAEADAVTRILQRCAGLPLALAIVAARAATNPAFSLTALGAELDADSGGLDVFAEADRSTDLRSVFSWSYRTLEPDTARMFRLVARYAGPEIGMSAAASLVGVPLPIGRESVRRLVRAHLLLETAPGRFAMHDLLREYGREICLEVDDEPARRGALTRLLDHYVHTAFRADRLLQSSRDSEQPPPPADQVVVPDLTDPDAATSWLRTEHLALLAAIRQAADAGLHTAVWHLAWSMDTYLQRLGHWPAWWTVLNAAMTAAHGDGSPVRQAHAHRNQARALSLAGRYEEAEKHLTDAAAAYASAGDQTGQAHAAVGLSYVNERLDRFEGALRHAETALGLYRVLAHRSGQAYALNNMASHEVRLGRPREALDHGRLAASLHHEAGDRHGEADAWDTVAAAHHAAGDHNEAVVCYDRALAIYRQLEDGFYEADTLTHLGECHRDAGRPAAAEDSWRRALEILVGLDHPHAASVRDRLAEVAGSAATEGEPP